jgi:alpha/beta superfamily hydrolase
MRVPAHTSHPELIGPAGPLETLLEVPADLTAPHAVAVICHPHPLYQGTLHNKVAYTLARSALGCGAPALRFNFRGVGTSAGSFDDAAGETDDALAALDLMHARWPDAERWLLGFSFGAQVALRAAAQRPLAKLVTVAPNVPRFRADHPAAPDCPWLLVQGLEDELVPAAEVLAWAGALGRPPRIASFPGVGHFFHGHLHELRDAVSTFLSEP